MSDTESLPTIDEQEDNETIVSLEARDMRKKKERKPYTLSDKALAARQAALAKAKEKLAEKEHKKYLALRDKYENKKEEKEEPAGDVDAEGAPVEPKPLKKGDTILEVKKGGKKKKKKVIYEESSDSSSSEEEVVVRRKKKTARRPKFTDDELLEMELERRLKMREEQDEFAKMEKAALQKRYKEKLAETKRTQMSSYMFPTGEWGLKRK
jgi:hypothetical protein